MTSPSDTARFHAEYDQHPDDRVRLFGAIATMLPHSTKVLYPGSYIDIGPSVWFDDVVYVDEDRRAARFFAETDGVAELIAIKRRAFEAPAVVPRTAFHHLDYTSDLPVEAESVGLLVSLYAGFISEHCTDYLAPGGTLLVNPSHGDAALASIDPRYQLAGVVTSSDGSYLVKTQDLDTYLVPKKAQEITSDSIHQTGRGIGYTRSPFAYLFTKLE